MTTKAKIGTRMPREPVELKPIRLFCTFIGLEEQKTGVSSPSICMARQISKEDSEDESELAAKVQSWVENPMVV